MKEVAKFICIILVLCAFIAGCKKLVTTSLYATDVLTTGKPASDSNDVACVVSACPKVGDTSCTISPDWILIPGQPYSALVGYHNYYNPGTKPCACWSWGDCAWRAYAKFDLSSLPSKDVVGAHLTWKSKSKVHYTDVATNETWCTLKIYIANEPWGKYSIAGDQFATASLGNVGVEIGGIVRDWVSGKQSNYGIFFVGPNEQLKAESNDICYTQLYDIKLDVTNSVSK
jgi:hypothetical protein